MEFTKLSDKYLEIFINDSSISEENLKIAKDELNRRLKNKARLKEKIRLDDLEFDLNNENGEMDNYPQTFYSDFGDQ